MFSFLRRFLRTPAAPTLPPLAVPPALEPEELEGCRKECSAWEHQPLISILTPVYRVPTDVLRAAVDSVLQQVYPHWELCLVYSAGESESTRQYLSSLAAEPRVRLRELPQNLGIAGNSNAALELAAGEYVALLDHDDALAPQALFEMVKTLQVYSHADVLYSDKDSFGINLVLKPQWSPELLWSSSYLTHLTLLRTTLVRDAGRFNSGTDGAQDWDLFLRAITRSVVVRHVPGVLYHWRIIEGSTATGLDAKPYVASAQLRALDQHLERQQLAATAVFDEHRQIRIRWAQPERQSVSILLIGGSAKDAAALRQKTRYAAFEVLEVPDASPASIQAAVRRSTGQCLTLLDRHTRPLHEAWLQDLVPPLQHPQIGAVAPLLLDPYTHQIRHAGFAFARSGDLLTPFAGETPGQYSPLGRNDWYRNWSALSGACLAVRRDAFDAAGGFTTAPWHARPDVDLCLRLQYAAGLRLLLNPAAHLEQLRPAWCDQASLPRPDLFCGGDPYFHPWLDTTASPDPVEPDLRALSAALLLAPSVDRPNSFAWCLPADRPAMEYRLLLAAADRLLRTHRTRSWFLIDGPLPAPICRRRIAELFPRLAADCTFEPIPVCAVVMARVQEAALALTVPGVSERWLVCASELPPGVADLLSQKNIRMAKDWDEIVANKTE